MTFQPQTRAAAIDAYREAYERAWGKPLSGTLRFHRGWVEFRYSEGNPLERFRFSVLLERTKRLESYAADVKTVISTAQ